MRFLQAIKLILFVFLLKPYLGFSGLTTNVTFSNWQKENGLPSNFVNAIEKDSLGFLWIGTTNGLCRYDGPDLIKIYQKQDNEQNGTNNLQSNNILSLHYDSKGYLWIGTRYGGITRFNSSNNKWKTYRHNSEAENSLSNDEVLVIIEDSKQRIWIGTEYGLNLFDRETETFTRYQLANANIPSAKAVLSIMEDSQGWIWAGTWAGGLHLLLEDNKGNFDIKNVRHFETTTNKAANNIWALFQDSNGRYWVGTHGGGLLLMKLPENASNKLGHQNWQPNFDVYTAESFNIDNTGFNTIQAIFEDQFDNLWIGTAHGLFKIPSKLIPSINEKQTTVNQILESYLPNNEPTSIIGNIIRDIYEDNQGLIWIATSDGLSQFNWYSNQFNNYDFSKDEYNVSYAPCFILDSEKNIWTVTKNKGLVKYKIEDGVVQTIDDNINDLILGERISTLFNKDGRWIYVGSELGITAVDLKTRKTIEYPTPLWLRSKNLDLFIRTIFVDNYGFIWFGLNVGLYRINMKTKTYTLYEPDENNPHSISDNAISYIVQDSYGAIWISTYKGLNRIVNPSLNEPVFEKFFFNENNPEKGPITNEIVYLKEIEEHLYIGTLSGICWYNFSTRQFSSPNSLENNFLVKSIEKGVNDDIWLSTSEGILNFNIQNATYQMFNEKAGLKKTSFQSGSSFKDVDNNIYFAYSNGFTSFSPQKLLKNEIPPPVYITEIAAISNNNTLVFDGLHNNVIDLNHNIYRLVINYTALNYNRSDKNQFKYRLVGFEDQWNETKFGTPIIYTKLAAKKYILEVKAANNDGVWNNNGDTITIIQHPPYWETWWFKLLALTLIVVTFLLFYLRNTNKIRKRNEELQLYNRTLNSEIITRKNVEQKLQDYNRELKRSNKDLEQFAYITAHDLKEPLHTISSFSNLLKKHGNEIDKRAIKYIDVINEGAIRMSNLIDSLLMYSIVGQKDSVFIPFDLSILIEEKITHLTKAIKLKNAIVTVGELPKIVGHQEQIGIVFSNLINNALKFNNQKHPIISIKHEQDELKYWKFSIKDNGIGIDTQYQKQIFGIFKRLHNKNAYAGTGIGLSICQKIIQRHRGKIWFNSELNNGTTFFFTIQKNLSATKQNKLKTAADVS